MTSLNSNILDQVRLLDYSFDDAEVAGSHSHLELFHDLLEA